MLHQLIHHYIAGDLPIDKSLLSCSNDLSFGIKYYFLLGCKSFRDAFSSLFNPAYGLSFRSFTIHGAQDSYCLVNDLRMGKASFMPAAGLYNRGVNVFHRCIGRFLFG